MDKNDDNKNYKKILCEELFPVRNYKIILLGPAVWNVTALNQKCKGLYSHDTELCFS